MAALALWTALQQDLVDRLRSTKVASVELHDASLGDLCAVVRQHLNCDVVVSPNVPDDLKPISIRLHDVCILSILKLTLKPQGLSVTSKGGVLVIVPADEVGRPRKVTKTYDVLPALQTLTDWDAPPGDPWFIDSDFYVSAPCHIPYHLDYGHLMTHGTGEPLTRDKHPAATLKELLISNTGGNSWWNDPGVSVSFVKGTIMVTQTADAHEEIERLVRLLNRNP